MDYSHLNGNSKNSMDGTHFPTANSISKLEDKSHIKNEIKINPEGSMSNGIHVKEECTDGIHCGTDDEKEECTDGIHCGTDDEKEKCTDGIHCGTDDEKEECTDGIHCGTDDEKECTD